ncbi:hypothetical protein SLEP1_g39652 [Rubroshorea leprosula]|uniref:Uncharacterized protein n=1 Tax=Rubroshorea leprosula TaxID=152421 RepID=A0AAV5L1N7_9ROSI|nr:hypothetical protein SLEP1_g39652 [Rubroshorea leprosula]
MGVMLGFSIPLLFSTLFATANLFIPAVHGGTCTDSKKSTLLIVFGDSFFDVGYGNDELCLPSKDQPYGKSLHPPVPTGRFSDGLVVPDYIAKYLDLADDEGKIAAYKNSLDIQQTSEDKRYKSLSFAMAGAGVTLSADKSKSLTDQVQIFIKNSAKLFVDNGANSVHQQDQTLYLFSIGTYDYLSNLRNIKDKQYVQEIAENVTAAIVKQVKEIAERQGVNGKTFAFMSVALRYLPVVRKTYYKDQSRLNLLHELEDTHHDKLTDKLNNLAQDLKAAGQGHIINYSILKYHRIIRDIMEGPENYGLDENTITLACCGDGSYHADGCGHLDKKGCSDPSAYVFWDGMHNTQQINQKIAQIFWNGPKNMTTPQNLQTLAGTQKPQYDFSVNANELISIRQQVRVIRTETQVTRIEEKVTFAT